MTIEHIYSLFKDSTGIFTDTRKVLEGGIFLAIKGDNFDGNRFAEQALEQGASYAIVSDKDLQAERCLLVEDTLTTLADLARLHRRTLDIPVVGLTGSNGKTTTKELLHAVLLQKFRCYATKGNLNNHIGVPLSVLEIREEDEIAIIEMGANHQKEIAFLSSIAQPTHGLITNIGKAHLEGFGGIEGVFKGKTELFDYLQEYEGYIFANTDDARLMKYNLANTSHEGYSIRQAEVTQTFPFLEFQYKDVSFCSKLTGAYNLTNMVVAIEVGLHFGVPIERSAEAIANYNPDNNRSEIRKIGNTTFILDAYNANPESMKAAVENLANSSPADTQAIILGDMLELGEYAEEEHRKILDLVEQLGIEEAYFIGPIFGKLNTSKYAFYPDVQQLKKEVSVSDLNNKTVLLKGSRGIAIEKFLSK